MPGRPFPTFGTDKDGRKCMFIGESHNDGRALLQLAWEMMYIHDRVDAIFIEYYRQGQSPTRGQVKQELTDAGFHGHRGSMTVELAQLMHQCGRYGVLLEGWNVANSKMGVLGRTFQSWNDTVIQRLLFRLGTMPAVRSYILFGGAVHGSLFRQASKSSAFVDLPCYYYDGAFKEYTSYTAKGITWAA